MHTYTTLGMFALAGSAVASPWGGRWGGNDGDSGSNGGPVVVYETAVVTVIVGPDGQPIGGAAPTPEPQPQPAPPMAEPTMSYYVPETPSSSFVFEQPSATPVPEPEQPEPEQPEEPEQPAPEPEQPSYPPSQPEEPAPEPEQPEQPAPPSNGGGGYMDVVNTWRAKLGLSELQQDANLEKNALKTCTDGNGQMVHQLGDGTMGQVLAPGQPNEFERVFVGGWLCEMPNMAGMDGVCDKMSEGWAYAGQTGHAEILSSSSYKKIGCANDKGIWGCDLGS